MISVLYCTVQLLCSTVGARVESLRVASCRAENTASKSGLEKRGATLQSVGDRSNSQETNGDTLSEPNGPMIRTYQSFLSYSIARSIEQQ